MVPVWVPLCMVAGLIFGVPVGAAHNCVALWTGCTVSVMIGRYFFRKPIRESLFDGDAGVILTMGGASDSVIDTEMDIPVW